MWFFSKNEFVMKMNENEMEENEEEGGKIIKKAFQFHSLPSVLFLGIKL